jgi:hypothetical protein
MIDANLRAQEFTLIDRINRIKELKREYLVNPVKESPPEGAEFNLQFG